MTDIHDSDDLHPSACRAEPAARPASPRREAPAMRRPSLQRLFILSAATALLGGCSCQGGAAPAPASAPARAARPAEPPPPPTRAEPPPVPEEAMRLHAQGRAHGEAGRFQEALEHFGRATQVAPGWHVPLYDTGFTYVLMGEAARALEAYERLEALAPQGVSDSRRVLECLRREASGRVPSGTLRQFIEVQRLRDMEEARRKLTALTRTAPAFYPAWEQLALSSEDAQQGLRLMDKALALEPDVDSRARMRVQRALLLRRGGEHEAASALLRSVIDDASTPQAVGVLARESLIVPGQP